MSNIWSRFGYVFLLMIACLFGIIVLFFLVFVFPLAAVQTFLMARVRRGVIQKLKLHSFSRNSKIQFMLLYPKNTACTAVCIKTGQFLCFYNTFEIVILHSEYPKWLVEKISREPKATGIVSAAILFRKALEIFRECDRKPDIEVVTQDKHLHDWFNYDSASAHYLTTSLTSSSQNILRTFIRNENISIQIPNKMFGMECNDLNEMRSALENTIKDLGTVPIKTVKLRQIAVEVFQ